MFWADKMKQQLLTTIAAVMLVGCATPRDHTKPRPLKEGEAENLAAQEKKRNDPPKG
jgi:hypothetical protein